MDILPNLMVQISNDMKKFFANRLKVATTVIGTVADLYAVYQIFVQTNFNLSAMLGNSWFWFFVLITVVTVALLIIFEIQDRRKRTDEAFADYKQKTADKIADLEKRMDDGFKNIRKTVGDEGIYMRTEMSKIHERINETHWKIDALKTNHSV